jgi:prepilin signal peptidase PulO-like enzyme (type II secretory pathway)
MTYLAIIPLGLLAGWLVNYLSDALPATRRFSRPTCPQCGSAFSTADYLLLRPCPSCGKARSWRTYITQAILFLGTAFIWISPPKSLNFWVAYILLIYLAVVFVIDLEHRLILHPVSLTGAALGLAIGASVHGLSTALIGGAVGFGAMLALYYLGEVFTRFMSKRRGQEIDEVALGFGDVNLAGVIGLMLGWPLIIFGLLFAILLGGAFSLIFVAFMLSRKKYEAFSAIPYAPFLVLSVIYVFYF